MSQCNPKCPPGEKCDPVCGEFTFTGPATVFSFNTLKPQPVFFIDEDGNEHNIGSFGGRKNEIEHYERCGPHVIKWCVTGKMPDCEIEEPVITVNECACPDEEPLGVITDTSLL